MIDVGAAQSARNLRQQVQLSTVAIGEPKKPRRLRHARLCFLQAFRRGGERDFPVDGLEHPVDAQHGSDTRSGEYMPSKPKRSRSAIQSR